MSQVMQPQQTQQKKQEPTLSTDTEEESKPPLKVPKLSAQSKAQIQAQEKPEEQATATEQPKERSKMTWQKWGLIIVTIIIILALGAYFLTS